MDIDKIIKNLNVNKAISHITLSNLNNSGLNEEEKTFLKTYIPEKILIIYGTLAPGRQNHHIIEHVKGVWKEGIIRGKLESSGWGAHLGYKAFRHGESELQEIIKAFVFFSDELLDNWKMRDEFEGDEYKRILAKYELDNGETGVGYIYALNEV